MTARVLVLGFLSIALAGAMTIDDPAVRVPEPLEVDGGGGPDAWGYTWLDSDTVCAGAPVFNWIDIKSVGTRVSTLMDDNVAGPFPVGFEFPFYWLKWSYFYVSSNGYIAFDDKYNGSHPFPDIPNVSRPNNIIAPLMSDLDFSGLSGNKGCWYWTNATLDTFILQCESVPFWGVPTSNNTFQVILSKVDSAITYQYREQTGAPYLGWTPSNATVGIENVTGLVGLRYLYGHTPDRDSIHDSLAIRIDPPVTAGPQFTDMEVRWSMNPGSGGIFLHHPAIQPAPIRAQLMNVGNQPVAGDSIFAQIWELAGDSLVWAESARIDLMAVGADTIHTFGEWTPPDTGFYILKVKSRLAADQNDHNDSILSEIHVVDYVFPTTLYYDADTTTGSVSLIGGLEHGFGSKFTPPRFPAMVDTVYFHFTRVSAAPVDVYIYDDNGPNGFPGDELGHVSVIPAVGWVPVGFRGDSINVQSGGFYVAYKTTTDQLRIAMDNTLPHARHSWEFTGSWAPFRWNETQDFRIRAKVVSGAPNRDIGVTAVLEPSGILDSGQVVIPTARVKNFGLWNETFDVTFSISGTPYQETRSKYLQRGLEDTVQFAAWTAVPGYTYVPRCSTFLATDLNPENDTLSGAPFDVFYRDVGAVGVVQDTVDHGELVEPEVVVCNFGNTAENFPVRFRIPGPGYEDDTTVHLGVGLTDTVSFVGWVADTTGSPFAVSCSTELGTDMDQGNDLTTASLFVRFRDVGAVAILAPTGTVDSGVPLVPQASVKNLGNATADFDVRFEIDGGYSDVQAVAGLDPGEERIVDFASWTAQQLGRFAAGCSVRLNGDLVPENNVASDSFTVVKHLPWPERWHEAASMPLTSSGKAVKRGGWLALHGNGMIYAAKGYKTSDFYSYDPIADTWTELADIEPGAEGKMPDKGCKGISDGDNLIYMTKGKNTFGYWQYKIDADSWTALPNVPAGATGKKVKGGTDLEFVTIGDTGFVYMLKGYKTEFWRYNTVSKQWQARADAPTGIKYKWDKGSWIVYDGDASIYAHKAKYYRRTTYEHEFWKYDIPGDSWYTTQLAGMPLYGLHSGKIKKKKAKDGGAGAKFGEEIYALKGGNTQQFWMYDIVGDTWTEQDTIPTRGSTGKKKRVKHGADLVHWGGGAFFALKGNKTVELWRYVIPAAMAQRPERSGVLGGRLFDTRKSLLIIAPNPLTGGFATLRYSLPMAGPATIHVFDVTGRAVVKRSVLATRTGAVSLDVRSLSAGIYLVRFDTDGYTATQKLVVQK